MLLMCFERVSKDLGHGEPSGKKKIQVDHHHVELWVTRAQSDGAMCYRAEAVLTSRERKIKLCKKSHKFNHFTCYLDSHAPQINMP